MNPSVPMQKLSNQFYNVFADLIGVPSLQLILNGQPLVSTSALLWQYFDTIPPIALASSFSPGLVKFSQFYQSILSVLIPQGGSNFIRDMGDYYSAWSVYLKSSTPTSPLSAFFKAWANTNIPNVQQANKCYTDMVQTENDPITQALLAAYDPNNFDVDPVTKQKTAKYIPTIDQLINVALPSASGKSCSFDSNTASSSTSGRWTSNSNSGAFSWFDAYSNTSQALSDKICAGHVTMNLSFSRVVPQFICQPGNWFNGAVLEQAYKTSDNTLWAAGVTPSWDTSFGPNGTLKTFAQSICVLDGISGSITCDSSFSSSEQQTIQSYSSKGFWPFYETTSSSSSYYKVTFDSSGRMTMNINSPLGNPKIFGVSVSDITAIFGVAPANSMIVNPPTTPSNNLYTINVDTDGKMTIVVHGPGGSKVQFCVSKI